MSDVPTSNASPDSPQNLFGQVAIELGLVTTEQLDAALKQQAEQPKVIGATRKIGEILHDRHVIELRAIQKVLLEQMRRRMVAPEPPQSHERKIGHFEILNKLGAGGMGHVYKARDTQQDRVVALKVLSLRLTDDEEFVARFKREVTASSSLQHPNIVAGISSGSLDGRPYLTMEFVDGQSLGKLIDAESHLPERKALLITREVARGLEFAHGKGVVHRDVKPDNVLVGENVIKLTDFGLAKILRDDQRLTRSGIALGTPHYISPEQVEASRYIDHRADLYGLGAMLFHMLTGHVPFEGENNNEIMLAHLNNALRDPRDLVKGISENTVRVLRKLMAKKAADRYDSAGQLLEDLDLVLDGKPPRHALQPASQKPVKTGCAAILLIGFAIILYLAK
jgi:serine/threonine protein kinase